MSATRQMCRVAIAVVWAVRSCALAFWHADHDRIRIVRPEADIREAGVFRLTDGGLVLRVRCSAVPPANALRLLVEVASHEVGRSHDTWMIEGDVLYRRSRSSSGWAWDEVGGVVSMESAYGIRSVLLPPNWSAPLRWAVETLNADWTVADRIPEDGTIESRPDRIQEMSVESVAPADHRPSLRVPPSLASRWADLAGGPGWTEDAVIAPLPSCALADGSAVRWAAVLRDLSGGEWALEAASSAYRGASRRWQGRAGPLDWTMLAVRESDGWTWLGFELRAEKDVNVEFESWLNLPEGSWSIHRPEGSSIAIGQADWTSADLADASGIGRRGVRSRWPFAVVGCETATVILAVDPAGPVPVLWNSSGAPPRFGWTLPISISTASGPLRGRATFAMLLRCTDEALNYRSALAAWHRLSSEVPQVREVPWQWRLSAADAVAAHGTLGGDIAFEIARADEPRVSGTRRCLRLRPWALDLPLPKTWEPDTATALRLLRFFSCGGGGAAWYAQAAMIGAVRDAQGSIAIASIGERQLRVAVSADPDLMTTAAAPWNRAMLELAAVQHALEVERLSFLALDGLPATVGLDFNPAALMASDGPLAWDEAGRGPGAVRDLEAFKFLRTARQSVGTNGPCIAVENPFDHHSTLASVTEMVVVDDVLDGDPRQGRVWRHRLLAGCRPVIRRLSGDFEWADSRTIESAVTRSVALGMVPSFGTDSRGRSYWSVPEWRQRDAVVLRQWLPLGVRLVKAGWNIVPRARANDLAVSVETFGATRMICHVVAWNRGTAVRDIAVTLSGWAEGSVVMDLQDASVWSAAGTQDAVRWNARLGPGEVRVFDVVTPTGCEAALAWLEGWSDPRGVGLAAVANFRAIQVERMRGVRLDIDSAVPFVRGQTNLVRARLQNRTDMPLIVADVRCGTDTGVQPVMTESRILGAGETASFEFPVDERSAATASWLLWHWRFQQPEAEWTTVRRTPSRWTAPLELGPLGARGVAPGVVEIVLPVRNYTDRSYALSVEWMTPDARAEQLTTIVESLESRDITLPITGVPGSTTRVEVRVKDRNRELFRGDVRALFAGDPLQAR